MAWMHAGEPVIALNLEISSIATKDSNGILPAWMAWMHAGEPVIARCFKISTPAGKSNGKGAACIIGGITGGNWGGIIIGGITGGNWGGINWTACCATPKDLCGALGSNLGLKLKASLRSAIVLNGAERIVLLLSAVVVSSGNNVFWFARTTCSRVIGQYFLILGSGSKRNKGSVKFCVVAQNLKPPSCGRLIR